MPINKKHYHPDWKDKIRPRILKRDQHRCKICGVPNKIEIIRVKDDEWLRVDRIIRNEAKKTGQKITRVILTVAHLNHIVTDNRDENLATLCQLHHIRHDREHKIQMRQVAKIWDPQLAIAKTKETCGHVYLNHIFVLARARRNQLATLLKIREKRSLYAVYSQYDKDLKVLLAKTRIEYKQLTARACTMLTESYGIEDPKRFLEEYWSSDTKSIGGKALGLTIPEV